MDVQHAGILAAVLVGLTGLWWVTCVSAESSGINHGQRRRPMPTTTTQQPHTLFVWDFDWTVINCNSDEYVPAYFLGDEATTRGFREHYKAGNDWHACVEAMVNQAMKVKEASPQQVLDVAGQMPYLTGVREALDAINNMRQQGHGYTTGQMILSDGNTLFIGAFLDRNGLVGHFSHGVVSNKGMWQDRLCVVHQSQQYGGHDCERCPTNLCKTQALQNTIDQLFPATAHGPKPRPRIVYVGDGANDACPVLKVLEEGDVMLARVGTKRKLANSRVGAETDEEPEQASDDTTTEDGSFGIAGALARAKFGNPPLVPKCQVWEWSSGEDLRRLVEKLLLDVK